MKSSSIIVFSVSQESASWNTSISSANANMWPFVDCWNESLTYIINRSGPTTVPWGTPKDIFLTLFRQFPVLTYWVLSDRLLFNRPYKFTRIPIISMHSSGSEWLTASNAFARSTKMQIENLALSIALFIFIVRLMVNVSFFSWISFHKTVLLLWKYPTFPCEINNSFLNDIPKDSWDAWKERYWSKIFLKKRIPGH